MDGSETVVKEIEKEGTNGGDPRAKIVIVDSGELKVEESDQRDNGDDPHHNVDLDSHPEKEDSPPEESGSGEEEEEE